LIFRQNHGVRCSPKVGLIAADGGLGEAVPTGRGSQEVEEFLVGVGNGTNNGFGGVHEIRES